MTLDWPLENPDVSGSCAHWKQGESNIVLDFHGDPTVAGLCIVSDGNHHMALAESIEQLTQAIPEIGGVFYVTLPPPAIKKILQHQSVMIGNLQIPVCPDVMLSPFNVMQDYVQQGICTELYPFVAHRGCALLVAKDNPKNIFSVEALLRDDVTLFLSNPDTEAVSHTCYRQYLLDEADRINLKAKMERKLTGKGAQGVLYGQCIHHREAPQALVQSRCDVAILYYHLALRFSRVFPNQFDMLQISNNEARTIQGSRNDQIYIGLVNRDVLSDTKDKRFPSRWAKQCVAFFRSDQVASIYQKHGLDTVQACDS